jgi:hypothetical protein
MAVAWFIDFEASSLSDVSYPIEVGYASLNFENGEIVSDGFLIAPERNWFDWSKESEKIHGIPRVDCIQYGTPANEAALQLNTVFGNNPVFCDAPSFDGMWNRRLFEYRGDFKPTFKIQSIWDLIMGFLPEEEIDYDILIAWRMEAVRILSTPNPHRAEADARLLASSIYRIKLMLSDMIAGRVIPQPNPVEDAIKTLLDGDQDIK